ncbi:hypothetical protein [Jeotgalibacillus aurantiacus]|uniref:hypothetical protein n=1 Tax=Jeotgalibacillus aurantiacus TaxID=2763266 RepID=UPI001D0B1084|nr:hypothetical protein [Jeotgalibacillus aurantiacus]
MKTIELTKWSDVIVPEAARSTVAVTNDHKILFLAEGFDQSPAWNHLTFRGDFAVRLVDQDHVTSIAVKDLPFVPAKLDTFNDGSVLIVSSTCRKTGDAIQQNARRYSLDGECLDEFVLGDGISRVAIDHENTIWVGYDKKGVKGSPDWNKPIGQSGLVAFSEKGEVLFKPESLGIDEVKALNVGYADEVYVHYTMLSHFTHFDRFELVQHGYLDIDVDIDELILLNWNEMLVYGAEKLYRLHRKNEFEEYEKRDEIMLQDKHGTKFDIKKTTIRMRGKDLFLIHDEGIYHKEVFRSSIF